MTYSGERRLWNAVLLRAINDLRCSYHTDGATGQLDKRRAINWLSTPSADLQEVCDMAGCDMKTLMIAVRPFISGKRRVPVTRPGSGRHSESRKESHGSDFCASATNADTPEKRASESFPRDCGAFYKSTPHDNGDAS